MPKNENTVGNFLKFSDQQILRKISHVVRKAEHGVIILRGCFCKENRGGEGHPVILVVSGFLFFPGHIFIKS